MQLLTELNETVKITEAVSPTKEKTYYLEGIYLQAEIKNGNGRVYPKDVLKKEVNEYITNYVSQNRAFGELGHPEGPQINLDRVSHMIVELKENGNDWYGKSKIIGTPMGIIAKNLIDAGAKLGVSSRALGDITERNGIQYVNELKIFSAADIVANPSAPDAFVRGLIESKNWVWESGMLSEASLTQLKKMVKGSSSRKLEEAKIYAFKKFMDSI